MAPDSDVPESWGQYRRLILAELERINQAVSRVDQKLEQFRSEDLSQIKTDIALLQLKASLWGGMAGVLVTMAAVLLRMVR